MVFSQEEIDDYIDVLMNSMLINMSSFQLKQKACVPTIPHTIRIILLNKCMVQHSIL